MNRKYISGVAVTPDDDVTIGPTAGLFVGGTGDLEIEFYGGGTVLLENVPNGTFYDGFCVVKVKEGTTATSVIALY
ncbi:spike base protein, RCAP_Rcc01079 family [Cohnella panacarvi]|uniref:spike base protein, RCAP_Rcc01079 family n=1 Tax=Cohnella panacarvi TaxID=400776 RepID=UPI00047A4E2B|nr:hypothetical protein [Cohnella panacarvi]